jgi:DNA-binding CsgD family transcriptional regulator
MDEADLEYSFFGKVAVCESMPDFERAIVPFLSKLFRAQSVLVILFYRSSRPKIQFRWIPDADLRRTFDANYADFSFMLDPFFQQCWLTQDWSAFLLRDIAPDRFENSKYYASYFATTNMVDDMGFVARLSEDIAVHLSVGRNSGERRFRARDMRKFEQVSKVIQPKLCAILASKAGDAQISVLPLHQQFRDICAANGKDISHRQAEVAALIIQGHSSRSIALRLCISTHTVKVHRRSLYKKLEITSQNELFGLLAKIN